MGTPALAHLQRYVASAIRRTSPLGGDAEVAVEVEGMVAAGPRGMTPADRLDVYREQFWLRHLASLSEDFPTLSWALGGPSAFDRLAIEYLTATPPRTWDLQKLGEGVPEHVATVPPWQNAPLLADAARLDWAYMHAFDAPEAAPVDVHTLAAIPEDRWPLARIGFHPALRALSLRHPVHALRRAVIRGEATAHPEPAPTFVAVWRDAACSLHDVELDPAAYELLTALVAGRPLGVACESVAAALDDDGAAALGAKVTAWFQEWTARGWITTIATAA